jgi:hypothetical protein
MNLETTQETEPDEGAKFPLILCDLAVTIQG